MVKRGPAIRACVYAVVACSSCRQPWLIESRHAKVTCPNCGRKADVARRRRLWQGDDVRQGQAAVAAAREAAMLGGGDQTTLPEPIVRHDDPLDAAAAKGKLVRNLSQRAETVALWLTRLVGDTQHGAFIDALLRAGLGAQRAEKEVVRMLAGDIIFEPRAGWYRSLEA